MTPRFLSGVGHGAMRARLESPRASYATPGFRIGTTRAPRRRQLPTKRCHAALLFGATRAYQPDSSSKPLHRQPRAGVLGNLSLLTRAMLGRQHRPRDRGRRYNPLDSWSFHISLAPGAATAVSVRLAAVPCILPARALEATGPVLDLSAFAAAPRAEDVHLGDGTLPSLCHP